MAQRFKCVVAFCSEIEVFDIAPNEPLEYCWNHHFLTKKPYGDKHGNKKNSMHVEVVFKMLQTSFNIPLCHFVTRDALILLPWPIGTVQLVVNRATAMPLVFCSNRVFMHLHTTSFRTTMHGTASYAYKAKQMKQSFLYGDTHLVFTTGAVFVWIQFYSSDHQTLWWMPHFVATYRD